MDTLDVADTLEPFGTVVGALLVLFGLGTLVGQPWSTRPIVVFLFQFVGIVAMMAVGAGLVWLSRRE